MQSATLRHDRSTGSSPGWRLHGRKASHYTRLARIFAFEAGVELELAPVPDMTRLHAESYGGHPALKLPLLWIGEEPVFGAENICRRLAAAAPALRVVWPEAVADGELRNAQELVWHAMQAQVQLVFGVEIADLPADNLYFAKARLGLEGALSWLEARLPGALERLPPGDISMLEASLFCLVTHLGFRRTVELSATPGLVACADAFGARASAQATPYERAAPLSA